MKALLAISVLCLVSRVIVNAAEVLRPRGVPLSKASFYDPTRDFSCLDGSATVPFSYVNDDYCDCQDGSDEPGTSACPNGFFHCPNIGHSPLNIPSSRVNDGVCDCCDASDEYASVANCVDTCRELGRAAREEAAKQQEERLKGFQMRQSMIDEGRKRKKEAEVKIEELKKDKEVAEAVKSEKEEVKKAVEDLEKTALEKYTTIEQERKAKVEAEQKAKDDAEAREAFSHLDNDGDGVLTITELQSRQTFDTNRDGVVSEEEAKFYLRQEDQMDLETFLISGWPMMRPTYKMDQRMFVPPTTELPPEELVPPPVPDTKDEHLGEEEEQFDDEDFDNDLDPEEDGEGEEEEEEEEEGLDDYDLHDDEVDDVPKEEEEEQKYDEETQKLVDEATKAREDFDEADRQLRDLTRELRSLEEMQAKDYGAEEEFRVLDGNCYEYTDREYIYRLCPFDKAVQKPKSGHGEIRLGQWGEWSGSEENRYSKMQYSNGQTCWNGPARSADVHLFCGTDTKVTDVTEPNRCEYLFKLSTPAVCSKPEDISGDEGTPHAHTEL